MSRFLTVHAVVDNTVFAAQVGDAVHLVASRLAGCAWWNDCENDRHLAGISRLDGGTRPSRRLGAAAPLDATSDRAPAASSAEPPRRQRSRQAPARVLHRSRQLSTTSLTAASNNVAGRDGGMSSGRTLGPIDPRRRAGYPSLGGRGHEAANLSP